MPTDWSRRVEKRTRRIVQVLHSWKWRAAYVKAFTWGIILDPPAIQPRLDHARWGAEFVQWETLVEYWCGDEAIAYYW